MNNKKITILFIITATMALLGIVGFTMAYFTSSTDFENEFQTGLYQTEATEIFTSPESWMPGDTTPKELTITNTGNVDVKARVCIDEEWTNSNDDTLPNKVNGESMAIINLANTSDWTKKGNCYEYNEDLEPGYTTSSFIESVTFNENAEASIDCEPEVINGTTTQTCTSRGDGYDNATYTLTLRVETVQANKASELWPDEVITYTTGNANIGGDTSGLTTFDNQEDVLSDNNYLPFYLKHKVEYGLITESYVEFIVSDEMEEDNPGMTAGTYALRGGGATYDEILDRYNDDSPYYLSNQNILNTAYGTSRCIDNDDSTMCDNDTIHGYASSTGIVYINNAGIGNSILCQVDEDGSSWCGLIIF